MCCVVCVCLCVWWGAGAGGGGAGGGVFAQNLKQGGVGNIGGSS